MAALGWEPRYTDLDRIVRTAWAWHRAHPDGFGKR
jgi:UDP-glucose 4-epimerase